MTGLALPLRLARREVGRRPGRTLLVTLLVALPVAAMAIAVVVIRTDRAPTALDDWERKYGQADAFMFPTPEELAPTVATSGDGDLRRGPDAVLSMDARERTDGGELTALELPAGSRAVPVRNVHSRVKTVEDRRADVRASDLPLGDGIAEGIHDLVAGRSAMDDSEVVMSASLARHLDVEVGDEVAFARPDATLRVVGLVEPVRCLSCWDLIVGPGAFDLFSAEADPASSYLIDLPDLGGGERWLGHHMLDMKADVFSPDSDAITADSAAEPVRWSMVLGAVALLVVGIVISAAFAVGARRQLVSLGQLSASGASPATIRTSLVLQGTVTGVAGAVAGLVIATLALGFGRGLIENLLDERIPTYTVRPADILLIAAFGVAAATLAALIPARTAASIPTLAALAGRRPLAPVPRRLIAWGAATFLGGLSLLGLASVGARSGQSGDVWMYVAILGGVAEVLGACAIAPAVVARLEPLGARLRGSWRLGARGLARHRARTGAVVSAVAAAAGLAITASALLQGIEEREGRSVELPDDIVVVRAVDYDETGGVERPTAGDPAMLSAVSEVLPDADTFELRAGRYTIVDEQHDVTTTAWFEVVAEDGSTVGVDSEWVTIADPAVLDAIDAPDAVRAALDEGLAVGLADDVTGPATLVFDGTAPAALVRAEHVLGYSARVLVSEDLARELGVEIQPIATVFRNPEPLTGRERDDVEDAWYQQQQLSWAENVYTDVSWYTPPSGPTAFQLELILTGLALIFALFVVGTGLALAAAESRDERDVLTIAGAPPGALARSAGARAWLMSVIGALMAIPVGFLPVVVFSRAEAVDRWDSQFPVIFPTRTVLTLLVALPLVVALVAWAASTTAQRLRPVRVSTATFE